MLFIAVVQSQQSLRPVDSLIFWNNLNRSETNWFQTARNEVRIYRNISHENHFNFKILSIARRRCLGSGRKQHFVCDAKTLCNLFNHRIWLVCDFLLDSTLNDLLNGKIIKLRSAPLPFYAKFGNFVKIPIQREQKKKQEENLNFSPAQTHSPLFHRIYSPQSDVWIRRSAMNRWNSFIVNLPACVGLSEQLRTRFGSEYSSKPPNFLIWRKLIESCYFRLCCLRTCSCQSDGFRNFQRKR